VTRPIKISDSANFYVSAERIFDPTLKGVPVIVLSNNDDPSLPAAPRPAARPVSSGLSQQVLQNHIVEHDVCHQALQLGVLVLKLLQASGVR